MVGKPLNQTRGKVLAAFMSLVLAVSMTPCVAQTALAADAAADYIASPALDYDAAVAVYGDYALMAKSLGQDSDGSNHIQYDVVNKSGQVTLSSTQKIISDQTSASEGGLYFDQYDFTQGHGYLVVSNGSDSDAKYGLYKLSGEVVWECAYKYVATGINSETGEVFACGLGDAGLTYLNLATGKSETVACDVSSESYYMYILDNVIRIDYFTDKEQSTAYYKVSADSINKVDASAVTQSAVYTAPDGTEFSVNAPVNSEGQLISVTSGGNTIKLSDKLIASFVYECADGYISFCEVSDDDSAWLWSIYDYKGNKITNLVLPQTFPTGWYALLASDRVLYVNCDDKTDGIYDFAGNLVADLSAYSSDSSGSYGLCVAESCSYIYTYNWNTDTFTIIDSNGKVARQITKPFASIETSAAPSLRKVGNNHYYIQDSVFSSESGAPSFYDLFLDENFNVVSGPQSDPYLYAVMDENFQNTGNYVYRYSDFRVSDTLDSDLNPMTIAGYNCRWHSNLASLASITGLTLAGTGKSANWNSITTVNRSFAGVTGWYAQDASGKWGAVSSDGKVIVPFEFDDYNDWNYYWEAAGYSEQPNSQYILVKKDGAWYFFDAQAAGQALELTDRISGIAAENTAVAISQETFKDGECDTVIIANDRDFMDSMSATGLAGATNAPILLVHDNGTLYDDVKAEIERVGASKAYVIGGPNAVATSLDETLKSMNVSVDRVYGNEAWDTSVKCANKIAEVNGGYDYAIVARSDNFQDALSMSSFAYKYGVPIILAPSYAGSAASSLPEGGLSILNAAKTKVFVAGGTGAIAEATTQGVNKTLERLWVENGFDTSNQIATYMASQGLLDAGTVCIASGASKPGGLDALAGAALAGKAGGVMLLANTRADFDADGVTSTVTINGQDSKGNAGFLTANAASVKSAYILGGAAVMPDEFVVEVNNVLS